MAPRGLAAKPQISIWPVTAAGISAVRRSCRRSMVRRRSATELRKEDRFLPDMLTTGKKRDAGTTVLERRNRRLEQGDGGAGAIPQSTSTQKVRLEGAR